MGVFLEPEQLSPTDEILVLSFGLAPFFLGSKGSVDGFYRQKTGRVLKNIKMRDRNVVVFDLLFLFLFALVLRVVIRTNVVFRVEKTLGPWQGQQKQCGVRFYFVCPAVGG